MVEIGNHHLNWFSPDKQEEQVFVSNWLSVTKFNGLAVDVFGAADWHIIDGFQSSIGRPDHTEHTPGGALVHFDHEVPDTHNHQLLSIIFEDQCPKLLSSCVHKPFPSRYPARSRFDIWKGRWLDKAPALST